MTKRVLDVGNCAPDHEAIRSMVEGSFDAQVLQAHGLDDTLAVLKAETIHLVLINRKLDRDYSDGVQILRHLKSDPQVRDVPAMLITNLDEHQQAAVAAGAEPGFGKLALDAPETREKLARFLKDGP